jgi:hypothetical protein
MKNPQSRTNKNNCIGNIILRRLKFVTYNSIIAYLYHINA